VNFKKVAVIVTAAAMVVITPLTAQAANPDGPAADAVGSQASAPAGGANVTDVVHGDAGERPHAPGINGVGLGVHVNIGQASLFQCPGSFCNQGIANANWPTRDDVADICHMTNTTTPWGGHWHLVLNHANNHVGFISSVFLTDIGSGLTTITC